MLSPKQWQEDEDLVYAWHSIMANENDISTFKTVSENLVVE